MADSACHGGRLIPSVTDGADVLRGLVLGAELRRGDAGWRFVDRDQPGGWVSISLGAWWVAGILRDAAIEWLLEDGLARQEHGGTRIVAVDRGRRFLRAIDDSVRRYCRVMKPLPIDGLHEFIANVRKEHPDEDSFGIAQIAAVHILAAIFGDEWVQAHVIPDGAAPTDFFRNAATDEVARVMGRLRLIQLAEMVFNLQYAPGLSKSLEMIRTGDIEPGFAELEVGRLLHTNDRKFEFVVPRGVKGDDYDLELLLGDVTACGETKCKLESTAISESSLLDTLNYGRRQLPKGKPGVLFVKVPQTWHQTDNEFTAFLTGATDKFFRSTGRIVSVKFHSSLVVQTEVAHTPIMLILERNNPNTRFHPDRDWSMLRRAGKPPPDWVILIDECARQESGGQ